MRYTATITRDSRGFSAQCVEVDAIGEGKTRDASLASLRKALEDRLEYVEGVAPPSRRVAPDVELVVVEDVVTAAPRDL
jgi:hypothetical protein